MALNYPVGGAVVADDLVWVCNQGDNTIEQLHFDGCSVLPAGVTS